jgi:putative multiple sugar transport system substrate-binding protein
MLERANQEVRKMKKNRIFKLVATLSLLTIALFMLGACGGNDEDSAGFIGIVLPTMDEPRWLQDRDRFEAALAGTAYSVETLFSQGSPAQELANVEALIARGIDVLIMTPVDGEAAAAAANLARDAGVTVISHDRLIMGTDAVDFYVTFDSHEVGREMGRFLVSQVESGSTGNPLYLFAGSPADNNAFIFFEGSWEILQPHIANGTFVIANSSVAEGLANNPNLSRDQLSQIINQITTEWNAATALNLAQANLVAAGNDMKGRVFILCPNDGTALAIASAFQDDPAITEFFITGQDAEIVNVQAIIDGVQSMTVFKDVRTLVSDSLRVATAVLEERTVATQNNIFHNGAAYIPSLLSEVVGVHAGNLVAELIAGDGYYDASLFTFPEGFPGIELIGVAGNPVEIGTVPGFVGIVLPTMDEPRWLQDRDRFEAALAGTEFTVETLFSQNNPAVEMANVEALITRGVEVLIITPVDGEAAAVSAEMARAAGVTVISHDRLIMGTNAVDYYVTFDSLEVGRAMGQFLVDQVEAGSTGNPLYIFTGSPADNNAFIFFEGSWQVLQPRIADGTFVVANSAIAAGLANTANLTREQMSQIIGQTTTEWNPAVALNLAEANLVTASDDMKGRVFILCPNDGTALSIASAFEADPAITEFIITGQDAEIVNVQAIIDGVQSMTVFKDVRTLVHDSLAVATAVLEGRTVATNGVFNNGVFDVPPLLSEVVSVHRYNLVAELIAGDGFYDASLFTFPDGFPGR